jgi:putative ABC transport system substrate-binding protein
LPNAAVVGVLVNPKFPPAAGQLTTFEKAAQTISQRIAVSRASNDTELEASFKSLLEQRVSALLVMSDPYFDTRRDRIIAFAAQNKLPAIYQFREYAVDGGLISYGPNITESYRHAGTYVGQILKGAKPADLPVFQPTKYEFVINLKTAKSLGLAIPSGLISFADEVIE